MADANIDKRVPRRLAGRFGAIFHWRQKRASKASSLAGYVERLAEIFEKLQGHPGRFDGPGMLASV
jgi:hypothetical protein